MKLPPRYILIVPRVIIKPPSFLEIKINVNKWSGGGGGSGRNPGFGGVIDPTTHKEGSQMQFMSCPGPNERMNMRCTTPTKFYGATYEKGLVGREFMVMEDIPKNHQLLIWYGAQWFETRQGVPPWSIHHHSYVQAAAAAFAAAAFVAAFVAAFAAAFATAAAAFAAAFFTRRHLFEAVFSLTPDVS